MKYAKATGKKKVDPRLLQPSDSDERYDFLIENHKRALEYLPRVQRHQHAQETWVVKAEHNECGTAACAFGWVTLAGILDGLRYSIKEKGTHTQYLPNINGKGGTEYGVFGWDHAAAQYFGVHTFDNVFSSTSLTMEEVLERLKWQLQILQRERKISRSARYVA